MTAKRPFRFGLCPGDATSQQDWIGKARRAEELGYSILLYPDHYVNPLATVPALSVAAAATTTLRVGSFVFDNDFRHPAMVAKEAATLDMLTGGRFEVGLGAGWHGPDYDQTGIPFESPGVRVGRLEESVAIIKKLFDEGPVDFSGKYYTVSGLEGNPRPVQQPRPPILIAGGSKRVLSLAAREADIVGIHIRTYADGSGGDISSTSADATLEKLGWIREAAPERFDSLEFNVLVSRVVITDNPRQEAEALAAKANRPGLTAELLLDSPNAIIGTVESIAESLERQRERYFISYIAVTEEVMEEFAPVVARLSGK